jgi:hypothetical protein
MDIGFQAVRKRGFQGSRPTGYTAPPTLSINFAVYNKLDLMKNKTATILVWGIVGTEVVLLLVPPTLFYLAGLLLSLLFSVSKGINVAFLMLSGILLLFGYSLCCLWWLVFKFRKLSFRDIPIVVWLGLTLGIVSALFFANPLSWKPPTPYISVEDLTKTKYFFGGGPLIVVVTILVVMYFQNRKRSNKALNPDAANDAAPVS